MRHPLRVITLLGLTLAPLGLPTGLVAQRPGRWSLHVAASHESFAGASRDTTTIAEDGFRELFRILIFRRP